MEQTATQQESGSARWALTGLALSMLLSSLGISIANVALPALADVFAASFREVQWVVIGYLLATTVTVVGVGRLGDIWGHRRVLLAGIVLFTLASALCSAALDLRMLIAARVLQGIGAAVLVTLAMAIVREAVPKARTGTVMGVLGTMSAIGTALGPSLGGIIMAGAGWRAIFMVMVPLGALNFFLARSFLPAAHGKTQAGRGKFDFIGTALLGLTLASYTLAVTIGGVRSGHNNLVLFLVAVVSGGCFLYFEARIAVPLIQVAMFRNAVLSAGLVMNLLIGTVMMATLVVGPFYLARSLGLPEILIGAVMSIGPVMSTVSGVPAGRCVDWLGARLVLRAGLASMAAGTFALSVLPELFGIPGYVAAMVVLTPGYQMFQAANNTAVMTGVGPDQLGAVSGLLGLSRNLGLLTGASVMGALFAFASGADNVSAAGAGAVSAGFRITFAAAGGLVLAALMIAIGSSMFASPSKALQEQ